MRPASSSTGNSLAPASSSGSPSTRPSRSTTTRSLEVAARSTSLQVRRWRRIVSSMRSISSSVTVATGRAIAIESNSGSEMSGSTSNVAV